MARTEVSGSQIKDSSVALSAAASPTGASDVTGVLPAVNGGTGLASPGASGNVLTSDGTNWTSTAGGGGGGGGSARVTSTVTSAVTLGSTAGTQYLTYIGSGGSVVLPTAVGNTSSYMLKNIDTVSKTIATVGDDTSFASVTTLLRGDGDDASAVFTDSSLKYTWTGNANVRLSTAVKKFGTASIYFGAGGNNAAVFASTLPGMGTGDFTIEMWFYSTVAAPLYGYYLYDSRPFSVNGVYTTLYVGGSNDGVNAQKLIFLVSAAGRIVGTTTITTNTWHHVAVSRSAGVTRLFLNGVQEGSSYTDTNNYLTGAGGFVGNTTAFVNGVWAGYVDDVRVTQGVSRYTANFTAPTAEHPVPQLVDGTYPLVLAPNQAIEIASSGSNWSVVSDAVPLPALTSTPTSATITTLTAKSNPVQLFTGTTTHTVRLPSTGIVAGRQFTVINNSTGLLTMQTSTGAQIHVLASGTESILTALIDLPTTALHWEDSFIATNFAAGKALTVNNTLTLATTGAVDGLTMTFPNTSATLARTDAANTFTGVQTMTSPVLNTPVIQGFTEATTTTSVSTAYTFVITASTQFLITLTANTTCTFTMPAASTTNSFTVQLRQPAATGNGAASFGGVRWPTNGLPTITTTAGRMDIINFLSDGTNWYGSYVQGYIY
jgi:hypothetical protein